MQRNQRSNCQCLLDHQKSKRIPEKHLLLFYQLFQSLWLCGSQQTVENSSKGEDHFTCLQKNLYACQEATVRTRHGTTDWFQIRKGVNQGCILSPCLFNLYAEYIMQNARLDETQAGIKMARRSINNLRYADGHHPYSSKRRGTEKPLDESERWEWKSWLKTTFRKLRSWHPTPSLNGK